MSAINNTPSSINGLSPLKFTFGIEKIPNVNFFVQQVTLPGLGLQSSDIPTPFIRLREPGDHLDIGEFDVTFRIDENMSNYLEIFNWITALGFPKDFTQYKTLNDADRRTNLGGTDNKMSDGTLIVHNSASLPNIRIKMFNMFPTNLSQLNLSVTATDVQYVDATVSFALERFEIEVIG